MSNMNIRKRVVCTGLILLVIISIITVIIGKMIVENNKKTATLEAELKATEISRIIESYVQDLDVWGTLLDEYGEDIINNFDVLAEGFYGESPSIRCVQMAPGGVVTYLHPYEGNEEAFGHDLFADPARVEEATLARESGNIILSGPLTLKQGGKGIITRRPIYSEVSDEPDHFWGFVMLVFDLDEINEKLGLEEYETKGYDYRLWRDNGDEKMIADESTDKEFSDAIVTDVEIPTNITWKLAVQPKNGWISRGYLAWLCISALIVFLLCMSFTGAYYQQKAAAEKEKAQQEALSKALVEAESANQAKSEFLSKMSHDIRTPINGVIGMTGIALKNVTDPKRVEDCLHKINNSSQHLFSLINDVLDMSKIESGKVTVNHEPFDLTEVAEKCGSVIQGQLTGRQIDFILDIDDITHPRLIGDALHLERIIINILGNSVKFTNDGDKIMFNISELSDDGKNALFRFVFEDTGIGMSADFLPKIFEQFSQDIEQSRTHYKGTGLGMALTKQYVEMLNGTIEVESELNKGTKFTIELPICIDHDAPADAETHTESSLGLDGRKILLVEDNELNAEIATEILKENGAEVTTAENGKAAIDTYLKAPESYFDQILMDIMMPEMDGLTAARHIRGLDRSDAKTIPIIAMTANAFEEDKKAALEAGMNAHIAKPIDIKVLLQVMNDTM